MKKNSSTPSTQDNPMAIEIKSWNGTPFYYDSMNNTFFASEKADLSNPNFHCDKEDLNRAKERALTEGMANTPELFEIPTQVSDRDKALQWWNDLPNKKAHELIFKYPLKEGVDQIENIWRQETQQGNVSAPVSEGHPSFVIQMGEIMVASELPMDEYACNILDKDDRLLAKIIAVPYYSYEQAEQIAKYFCKALNSYQSLKEQLSQIAGEANASVFQLMGMKKENDKLKEQNRELLDVVREAKTIVYNLMNGKENRDERTLQAIFDKAITKAEQLK